MISDSYEKVDAQVIEVNDNWLLVECQLHGTLDRRYLPRILTQTSSRGPATFAKDLVEMGVQYGDVVAESFGAIQLSEFLTAQKVLSQFRLAGFWFAADYAKNPSKVRTVLKTLGVDVDPAIFINSVMFTKVGG